MNLVWKTVNRSKLFETRQKILFTLLGRVMYPQKNTYVKMIVYLDDFKKYDLVYEQDKIQGVACGHLFSSPKVLLDRLLL